MSRTYAGSVEVFEEALLLFLHIQDLLAHELAGKVEPGLVGAHILRLAEIHLLPVVLQQALTSGFIRREEVQYALRGEEYPGRPALKERVETAVEQFRLSETDHGEKIACLEARKHFAWYLKGVRNASYYKKEITALTKMEDIYRVAKEIVRDLE